MDTSTGKIVCAIPVLILLEWQHRGEAIWDALTRRRAFRRRRRKLRYRPSRFDNRTRPKGWLAPSLRHRVDTVLRWVTRIGRLRPITALSQELMRFDTQALEHPEISGTEYQQGSLFGYEVGEYESASAQYPQDPLPGRGLCELTSRDDFTPPSSKS